MVVKQSLLIVNTVDSDQVVNMSRRDVNAEAKGITKDSEYGG